MYSVVGTDGEVYGPVNEEQIGAWINEGRVQPDTNLVDAVYGRVVRARDVPLLATLFHAVPPPPPPVMYAQPQHPGYAQSPQSGYGQPQPGPVSPLVFSPGTVGSQTVPVSQTLPPVLPIQGQGVQVNNYISVNTQANAVVMVSPKSKTTAILLCVFLGGLGIHRFYLGRSSTATAMLLITVLSCGWLSIVSGVWALVDLIQICTGGLKDNDERALV